MEDLEGAIFKEPPASVLAARECPRPTTTEEGAKHLVPSRIIAPGVVRVRNPLAHSRELRTPKLDGHNRAAPVNVHHVDTLSPHIRDEKAHIPKSVGASVGRLHDIASEQSQLVKNV